MIQPRAGLTPALLLPKLHRVFELSAAKIRSIEETWSPAQGSPVCTVNGRYTTRGWTEWTQGFQFGSAILQFDATGEAEFLAIGRERTVSLMAPHLTHTGVHDHGFNNVSTYGNLLRLMNEGRIPDDRWERRFYELALRCPARCRPGAGRTSPRAAAIFIRSTARIRCLSIRFARCAPWWWATGWATCCWARTTAAFRCWTARIDHARLPRSTPSITGKGRDAFDVRGRMAHESIFNVQRRQLPLPATRSRAIRLSPPGRAGSLGRCADSPSSWSFWIRWLSRWRPRALWKRAARATCDFYIANTPPDGIPYWDTGRTRTCRRGDWRNVAVDPADAPEPIDSSAAAIAAQGLLRLGRHLADDRYWQAGLAIAQTLFDSPYLSTDPRHQGLLLHSVYHRPNGWNWQRGGVFHVGRLSLPRAGAVSAPRGRRRTLSQVLGLMPRMLDSGMARRILLLILAPAVLPAAGFPGSWEGEVVTAAERIPFQMEISASPARVCFFEDREPVCSSAARFEGDTLRAQWDYLNSRLTLAAGSGTLKGTYVNLRTKLQLTIEATPHRATAVPAHAPANFDGEWEVHTAGTPGPGDHLVLRQSGAELQGTTLRIDGDDGTLVGRVDGNRFAISHFSGDRPTLLRGTLQPDGTISLESDEQKLVALRPAAARARHLPPPLDPATYARVRNPAERFRFRFRDVNGRTYTQETFAGKPYVISITGSWCPNCRDEAPFLVDLYRRYHPRGLEMAAFCFESADDPTWAPLRAFVRRYGVQYPVLLAGEPSAGRLKTAVPQIVNLAAYPTSIYVGRDGTVRAVHTGFPSRGSGAELARAEQEIRATVERLLAETAAR